MFYFTFMNTLTASENPNYLTNLLIMMIKLSRFQGMLT